MPKRIARSLSFAVACVVALTASPATALTCGRPDLRQHLEAFFKEGISPTVIAGYFRPVPRRDGTTEAPDLSVLDLDVPSDRERLPSIVPLLLSGAIIEKDQSIVFDQRRVEIAEHCALQWCGSVPSAPGPALFVLIEKDGGFTGAVGPCGGSIYRMPSLEQMSAIEQCISNQACGPDADVLDDLGSLR